MKNRLYFDKILHETKGRNIMTACFFICCADFVVGKDHMPSALDGKAAGSVCALMVIDLLACIALVTVGVLALKGRCLHMKKSAAWALTGTAIGILSLYIIGTSAACADSCKPICCPKP